MRPVKEVTSSQGKSNAFLRNAQDNLLCATQEYVNVGEWRRAVECVIIWQTIEEGNMIPPSFRTAEGIETAIVAELLENQFKELHEIPIAVWEFLSEKQRVSKRIWLTDFNFTRYAAEALVAAVGASDIISENIKFQDEGGEFVIYSDGSVYSVVGKKSYVTEDDFFREHPKIRRKIRIQQAKENEGRKQILSVSGGKTP